MNKLFSLSLLLLACILPLKAQENYSPTTAWPYIYSSFRSGTIQMQSGKVRASDLNIHIRHGKLHYLENNIVKEMFLTDVLGASIGGDNYLNAGDTMVKVLAMNEKGCVVEQTLGDYAALLETGGAYGSSSVTSATRKLSSIDTDNQINQNYMILMQNKDEGQSVPLESKLYLMFAGNRIAATRSEVEKWIPDDRKEEWKQWRKSHKIKWNQPNSILTILDFLNP